MMLGRRYVLGLVFLGVLSVLPPSRAIACHSYEVCYGDTTKDWINDALQKASEAVNDAGNYAKESGLGKMYTAFSDIKNAFSDLMGLSEDKAKENLEAKLAADLLYGKMDMMSTNAQIQADTDGHMAALAAESAMNAGINAGGADQFLCNVVKVRQGVPVMDDFATMVARIIAMAIDATYAVGTDGPRFWVNETLLRCGMAEGYELKTGNPLDDVPAQCRAPVQLTGLGTAELDMNASFLARDNSYVLPFVKEVEVETNGVKQKYHVFSTEAEDEAVAESMKRWMKAAQYCYLVADYRPPPPIGAGALTPVGRAKTARFASCRARQALFTMRCAYRLARLTKPNCGDPDMKPFCSTAIEACAAAKTMNLVLDPSYNGCTNGLSADQSEYISIPLCDSTHRVESDALSGETEGQKLLNLARCSKLKADWQDKLDREDANFRRSVQGLSDIKDCFEKASQM